MTLKKYYLFVLIIFISLILKLSDKIGMSQMSDNSQKDIEELTKLMNSIDLDGLKQIEYFLIQSDRSSQSSRTRISYQVSQLFSLIERVRRPWIRSSNNSTTQKDTNSQQQQSSQKCTTFINFQKPSPIVQYRQHLLKKIFNKGLPNQIQIQIQYTRSQSKGSKIKYTHTSKEANLEEDQIQIQKILQKHEFKQKQNKFNHNSQKISQNCINFNSSGINNNELRIVLNYRPFLQTLSLMNCYSISQLKMNNFCHLKQIRLHQSKIKYLQLRKILNLSSLELDYCEELSEVALEQCDQLTKFYINKSKYVQLQFKKLKKLQVIHLRSCGQIYNIESINCCPLKQFYLVESGLKDSILKLICNLLANLQKLHLDERKSTLSIFDIPDTFQSCSKLKILVLLSIRFTSQQLDKFIIKNQQLTVIQLKYCFVKGKTKVQNLKYLKRLDIDNSIFQHLELNTLNNLSDLRSNFQCNGQFILVDCQKLSSIQLGKINIIKLELKNLLNMKQIRLSYTLSLKQINIKDCDKVSRIYIHRGVNNVQNFLKDMQNLPQLQFLHLQQLNQIVNVNITKFQKINQFHFLDCNISQFTISQLPNLQLIQIKGFGYKQASIKLKITKLQKLKLVSFDGCNFSQFEMSQLPNLQLIQISESRQQQTSIKLNIQKLQKLKSVRFDGCNFSQFKMSQLPNLQLIQISRSGYKQTSIKLNIKKLQKLRSVRFRGCNFSQFKMSQLSNLQSIYVIGCKQCLNITNIQKLKLICFECCKFNSFLLNQNLNLQQVEISKCIYQKSSQFQIKNCSSLKKIQLSSTTITNKMVLQLNQYQKGNPFLKVIEKQLKYVWLNQLNNKH